MTSASKPTHLRFAIVAADTAFFRFADGQLYVRLVRIQGNPHFPDHWGLPGGLIGPAETAEQAADRHLRTKAGMAGPFTEQLYTFSALKRDPRGRVIATAYLGLGHDETIVYDASVVATNGAQWFPVSTLPRLAYDHRQIIATAVERIANKLTYSNIARFLLPSAFTLSELQGLYERISSRTFDKRNFRKKMLSLPILASTGRFRKAGASRPAELYRFKGKKIQIINML